MTTLASGPTNDNDPPPHHPLRHRAYGSLARWQVSLLMTIEAEAEINQLYRELKLGKISKETFTKSVELVDPTGSVRQAMKNELIQPKPINYNSGKPACKSCGLPGTGDRPLIPFTQVRTVERDQFVVNLHRECVGIYATVHARSLFQSAVTLSGALT